MWLRLALVSVALVLSCDAMVAARDLVLSLEQIVRDSDRIVVATLRNPSWSPGPSERTRTWTASLDVDEVLLWDRYPEESVVLTWVEFEGFEDFSRHFERLENETRVWLLVEKSYGVYRAHDPGRWRDTKDLPKIRELLN